MPHQRDCKDRRCAIEDFLLLIESRPSRLGSRFIRLKNGNKYRMFGLARSRQLEH